MWDLFTGQSPWVWLAIAILAAIGEVVGTGLFLAMISLAAVINTNSRTTAMMMNPIATFLSLQ